MVILVRRIHIRCECGGGDEQWILISYRAWWKLEMNQQPGFWLAGFAARDQSKHIPAPPKICPALEIADPLFKLCIYVQIQCFANQKM